MDRKSKILLGVFSLAIILSIGATYWRIMVKRDFVVEMQVDCDPASEVCFVGECDPEVEQCTGDPEQDTYYYKMLSKKAANMPSCDLETGECPTPKCEMGEEDCEETLCSEELLEEGQSCSDPADFIAEEEDEEAVCEGEAEEECLEGGGLSEDESVEELQKAEETGA